MSPTDSLVDTPIHDLFARQTRPLLSYEFFPPKSETGLESLGAAVEGLMDTHPDFVTVTYGAGGSTRGQTLEIAEWLRRFRYRPVMPHLTCVGHSREELEEIADQIYADGFRNIMTLRGDPPKGQSHFEATPNGFGNARDLAAFLKKRHPDFCLGVAGYPEGHPESQGRDADLRYLKEKVDAGASFITTQLFLENTHFYRFRDACVKAGIDVPILPGLMPALSIPQIQRITTMCQASLPAALLTKLEAAGENTMSAGILWCMEQIVDLLQQGVPGIHLYVLNQIKPALSYQLACQFIELTRSP